VSDERTESESERSGRSESITKETLRWGLRPQTPGIYRVDANPSESNSPLGLGSSPNPSLVLAPESALSLLPSRGLSSAPVACSVSAMAVLNNHGTKKELDYPSAFRHVRYRVAASLASESNHLVIVGYGQPECGREIN
jgi:hypothetical protein